MLTIKKVGTESIEIINGIAHTTWPVSYKGIISDEQINYMLELMYSKAELTQQIENLHHQFIVGYDAGVPVGFASYGPKQGNNPGIFRLNKLYLLPNQQGRGSGKILLDYIIDDIKTLGATGLELNVNKANSAFHFYTKNGFIIKETEVLDIGNGYVMDDYVMLLKL